MDSAPPPTPPPETPHGSLSTPGPEVCPRCGQPTPAGRLVPQDQRPRLVLASSSQNRDADTVDEGDADQHSEPSPHPDPFIGMVVGNRYRMVECIGRGGMGLIYKVEHTELGKFLALKLLAGEFSRDRRVVRRFKREALLVSKLSHPNTVQVFDYGSSDGLTWLVMELVDGKDLAWIVKMHGPMPYARLVPIAVQVCNSLAEAHGVGIIHRDIKLGNIMVSPCCREGSDLVKVLDFGLAKLRDAPELAEVTGAGNIVGTPHYMAPEQIRGKEVDGRTDVYSLGAVMYRALTGELLFKATTPAAVFEAHLHEKPVPPRQRAPSCDIPPAVSEIVMKALEKRPEDRFQSVEELREALIDLQVIGPSSLNVLLDAARLDELQRESLISDQRHAAAERPARRPATRDEVAAFERKLKRQRWTSVAAAALIAFVGTATGVRAWQMANREVPFDGVEREPNDTSRQANVLPLAAMVRGKIGKRIDPTLGDRDFYRVEIPGDVRRVSLRTSSLPNMGLCTYVYGTETDSLEAKFCMGKPGLALEVPDYRLEPGTHYLAVLQDREHDDAMSVLPVVENVSDDYELSFGLAVSSPESRRESEPNDSVAGADLVAAGEEVAGMPGWLDDMDYVCAAPEQAGPARRVRWVVRDGVDRARDRGKVLEVTQNQEGRAGIPIRVHRASSPLVPGEHDQVGPWKSQPFLLEPTPRAQCLKLKLVADPKSGTDVPIGPLVAHESWSVRLELAE